MFLQGLPLDYQEQSEMLYTGNKKWYKYHNYMVDFTNILAIGFDFEVSWRYNMTLSSSGQHVTYFKVMSYLVEHCCSQLFGYLRHFVVERKLWQSMPSFLSLTIGVVFCW